MTNQAAPDESPGSAAAGAPHPGGLSAAEAAGRLAVDGPNQLPRPPEPSSARRALRHLAEPLSLVLLAAAALSVSVLGRPAEGFTILAIVVLNVVIATVQEHRSAAAVRALEELTAPTARARRDGATIVVPSAELVRGDIVEVAAGDRVPADLQLLESAGLAVDEAILTGESWPVEKDANAHPPSDAPLGDRTDRAFSGTLAVRGHGSGVVVATGAGTEIGRIAGELGDAKPPPLVGELQSVALRMSALAVVVGAALVPVILWRSRGDEDRVVTAVLGGVALAVAAIPEGMATIVTTALALGARRMAVHGAIVRNLAAIDGLGTVDVVCTDKTGTLTTGQLGVAARDAADGRDDELWLAALRCNDARDGTGDPVDVALAAAAGVRGPLGRRIAERPYDPATRSMTTVHAVAGGSVLTLKGAPEVVFARCRSGPATARLGEAVERFTGDGLRALALATTTLDTDAEVLDLDAGDLEPLGVVALADPLRPSAASAVADLQRAGIRIVLATGDHLGTAEAIAAQVGLTGTSVSGDQLALLDPTARRTALAEATVVARVDPSTKVDLVDAHHAAGRIVAMTGDGVNDAPALERADVGVAVAGSGGTDVARGAAQVVVTDGDLGTLTRAVQEGRRIRRNLRTVVRYLLTGNLSEVIVVVGAILLFPELAVPLLPVQILWVNLVTDGLPALALGVDVTDGDPLDVAPEHDGLLDRARLRTALVGALSIGATVLASGLVAQAAGWSPEGVRTQLLLSLLVCHLALAYVARARRWTFEAGWWRNRTVFAAIGGSLALQLLVFGTAPGRAALAITALPPLGWGMAVLSAIAMVAALDLERAARRAAHG